MTWVLSAMSILTMWLAGNRSHWAWIVMLGNQGLWLAWIIKTGTWGLLPMNVAMWIVAIRNLCKWTAREREFA